MEHTEQRQANNSQPQGNKRRRLNNDERQRAVRACDSCRKLKEKCEGGVPCSRCTRFKRLCKFTDTPAKPVETGGTTAEDSTQPRLKYALQILHHYHPDLELDTDNLRRVAEKCAAGDPPAGESSAEEDVLAIEDENYNINVIDDNNAHYSGEFSYWNFSERIKRHVMALNTESNFSGGQDPTTVPHYWRVDELYSDMSEIFSTRSVFPPRQIATFLVQAFFKHATTNYWFVDRTWLEKRIDIMYNKPGQLKTSDAGSIAIALTVFAIGTQYAELESPPPDKEQAQASNSSNDQIGIVFYQSAVRLLPQLVHLASLESVQACLLFGLYKMPIDAAGLGYIYINLAIKLAMQNGMHRRSSSQIFNAETLEMRNRVWWTLHCIERKISMYHGRPVCVILKSMDTDIPAPNGPLDRSIDSISDFSLPLMINIAKYLEDFFDELFLLRKCQKSELSSILTRICTKKDKFRAWWESTSLGAVSKRFGPHSRMSRSSSHGVLEYCLVRMFVGRPFLLSRTGSITSSSPKAFTPQTTSTTSDKDSTRTSRVTGLVDDCVQAALEAVELCQSMRENGTRLARFSYIEYSACRASLLVLIAFCIRNRTDRFYFQLRKGLKIIRELTASDSAEYEVRLIHALERAVERLPTVEKESPAPASEGDSAADYDGFRQWLSCVQNSKISPFDPDSHQLRAMSNPQQEMPTFRQDVPEVKGGSSKHYNSGSIDSRQNDISQIYTGFEGLQSAAGSAFFEMESYELWSMAANNSERHLIEDFLSIPHSGGTQFTADANM